MILKSSFPFRYNKDESVNALRFPDLSNNAYVFSITTATSTYTVQITFSTWLNLPLVSVYTNDNVPITINMPLTERVSNLSPNFLSDKVFKGYYLFWEPETTFLNFYGDV